MYGKKKKKALTKQERRIASSVNTKPKKSFKQNKTKTNASNSIKTKINDSKDKTNYLANPIQGFYEDKEALNHPSYQIACDDKTWTRFTDLSHTKPKHSRCFVFIKNPNPEDNTPAYLRKYIKTSKIGTRGKYYKTYVLQDEYRNAVMQYYKEHENKKNKK